MQIKSTAFFLSLNSTAICFDNDFEIESKYHRKICCLVVLAHILSSQDVVFRSTFFLIAQQALAIPYKRKKPN